MLSHAILKEIESAKIFNSFFIGSRCVRKQEALLLLAKHQNTLKDFGVRSLLLFGSVARDEAHTNSDVDL